MDEGTRKTVIEVAIDHAYNLYADEKDSFMIRLKNTTKLSQARELYLTEKPKKYIYSEGLSHAVEAVTGQPISNLSNKDEREELTREFEEAVYENGFSILI